MERYPPGHILCRPSRTEALYSSPGSLLFDTPNDHNSVSIQTVLLNRDAVTRPQTKRFRYRCAKVFDAE